MSQEDDVPFGVPTESERLRATDAFHFPLPELPKGLTRENVLGRDRLGRIRRLVALGLVAVVVALGSWRYRAAQLPLAVFTAHAKAAFALATTPAHRLVASGADDHTIQLYSLDAETTVGPPIRVDQASEGDGVNALAFSPQGDLLLVGTGRALELWSVEKGRLARSLDTWEKGFLAVAFSPRGDLVAASRRGDPVVRVYSTKDGALAHTLQGHPEDVFALAFAPMADQLASAGSDGTIRLWGLESFKEVKTTMAHEGTVFALAYAPGPSLLASAGADHQVKLWAAADLAPVAAFATSGTVRALAFAPEGDRLFFGGDDAVLRGIATRTGAVFWKKTETARPLGVVLASDGTRLAVSMPSGEVHFWRVPRT